MLAESRFFRDLICYDFCWCGCPNIMPSSATLWRQSTRGYTLWTPSPLFTPADTSSVLLHTSTVMMQQKSSAIKVNESRSSPQRLSSHWRHNQWTSCLKTVVFLSDVIPLYRLCGRCSVAVASTGTGNLYSALPRNGTTCPGCWILSEIQGKQFEHRHLPI